MLHNELLLPVLVQVGLVFLVWASMMIFRIYLLISQQADARRMDEPDYAAQIWARQKVFSDNFSNQFELPVLFYLAIVLLLVTGLAGETSLVLAWLFAFSRIIHSGIHLSYNNSSHRFVVYIVGALILWMLWGTIFWSVIHQIL